MRSCWKTALTAVSIAAGLSLVAGCSTPADDGPTTIRIGVGNDQLVGSYDPTVTTMFPLPVRSVYDGLFEFGSGSGPGGFQPELATGYERSEDWKTVTLTLRDDVTFVDGVKFNAEALKTYLDGMHATEGWWVESYWQQVSPVLTVEDEYTLVISSEQPMHLRVFGFLALLFDSVPIASPGSLDDLAATATEPLGSGPYVIDEVTPDVGVTLVRSEDYWDADAFPYDTVEITVFTDDIAALNALKAGQIDATRLSIPLADEAANEGFVLSESLGRFTALYIADRNGTTNPAFADQRVRQAIALAFDRETINESLNLGYGDVSSQPFFENFPEYVPGGDDRYGYDPERAKELLAEAGYADGFDLVIPSTPFLGINAWEPVVTQYLGDIGIRVTFETFADTGEFFGAATGDTTFPVLMYSEHPSSALPVFITATAVFNPFKIADPTVDELWAVIQSGPDDAANEAAAELGEYVLDQAILIPFTAPRYIWASSPEITVTHDDGYPLLFDFQPAD